MRVDAALKARGLAESRERARKLIEAGLVTVNGRGIEKPAFSVSDGDVLAVVGALHPYVGRGGLKLQRALEVFEIDPTGRVCMDIGASTGGFTDVLLKGGAQRVYAIDVGEGQLHPSLRGDPRVVNLEHTNARALSADMFSPRPTLGVMDVSFISIRLILPAALQVLGAEGRMIALIKPQFEAGRGRVGKGGIVSDAQTHGEVVASIRDFLPPLGWRMADLTASPVTGGDGNIEFLADLMPDEGVAAPVSDQRIAAVVAGAHKGHLTEKEDERLR